MNNTVDPEKLKKAPIASSCFMGLGQILYLKQYIRGALFALVEIAMICAIVFGTKKIIAPDNATQSYLSQVPDTYDLVDYLSEGAAEYEDAAASLADLEKDSEEYKDALAELNELKSYGYASFGAKLESITNARASAMKAFFTKTAVNKLTALGAKIIDESDDIKDASEELAAAKADNDKDAVKEASENLKALKEEAKELKAAQKEELKTLFDEYDFTDLDSVSDAETALEDAFDDIGYEDPENGGVSERDRLIDKYEKISARFDHIYSVVMAKAEARKFDAALKSEKAEYSEELKQAEADFESEKQTIKNGFKTKKSDMNKKYSDSLEVLNNSESTLDEAYAVLCGFNTFCNENYGVELDNYEEVNSDLPEGIEPSAMSKEVKAVKNGWVKKLTNKKNLTAYALDTDFEDQLVKSRFAYENHQKKIFNDTFGDVNSFDKFYDGCDVCRRAASGGKRTVEHRTWGRGPIVSSLIGLVTLGDKQNTKVANFMDHSVFMMINGIFALIIIAFFVVLYAINIGGSKAAVKKITKNGRFPTFAESKGDISQNSFATIGIAPSVVLIAVFSLIPLLFSALVAFTNYSSPDHIPPNNLVDWVGFQNFVTMFSTKVGGGEWAKTFGNTAVWTIVWAVFATFSCFFVGFFYAFVLQDKRVVIPTLFRTVYILPYAIPTMLSLFVWANLLNGTIGPINRTLMLIHLIKEPIPFLSSPWVAKGTLIFVNIWIGFPYSMILTTSSMTAIPNSLYEAAVIDGATKWDQFKSITYPLVMFQLKPTLIMQFASNINNFGAVFFLTGGGPNLPQPGLTTTTSCGATDLLISWIYKLTMNTPSRYHLASVLSLLVFVVLVPFALYNFTRTKSFKEGEV